MIPQPDFRIDIAINVADEVIRMGCVTVGFIVAVWGIVKMTDILFGTHKVKSQETDVK